MVPYSCRIRGYGTQLGLLAVQSLTTTHLYVAMHVVDVHSNMLMVSGVLS